MAKVLGINLSTASEMRRRQSMPVRYWPSLIAYASANGLKKQLTAERLMEIHAGVSAAR